MDWKIVAASARGSLHMARGNPCQDSFHWMEHDGTLVAVVSDGAGTAAEAEYGAYHAAKTICEEILIQFSVNQQHPDREELEFWIKTAIKTARKTLPGVIHDKDLYRYHATVVGVVVTEFGGLFFHIGDGAAIAVENQQWSDSIISQPENGNTADKTYFYTEPHWYKHIRFTEIPQNSDLLALMSDGVTSFMMDQDRHALNEEIFEPIDRYLQDVEEEKGNRALLSKLESPETTAITNDDKTLLWARRVQ